MHRRVKSRPAAPTAQQTSTLSAHLFLQNVPLVSSRQQKTGFIKSVRPQSSRNASSSIKHCRPTLLQSDLGHLDCWWFVFLQVQDYTCTVRQLCIDTGEAEHVCMATDHETLQCFLSVSCSCAQRYDVAGGPGNASLYVLFVLLLTEGKSRLNVFRW